MLFNYMEDLKEYLEDKPAFDLGEFKNINSYKGRTDYALSHLSKLGAGSSRIVYDLGNNTVLKLAKNQKGVAQNKTESELSEEGLWITAKILEHSPDYIYVIMEKAEKMKPSEFKQFFGYDYHTIDRFLRNEYQLVNGKRGIFHIDSDIKDELRENEYINEIMDLYYNYNILPHDFGRLGNWGVVVRNGKREPVIIDFGFDKKTASTYYKMKMENIKKKYQSALNENGYKGSIGEWIKNEWLKF